MQCVRRWRQTGQAYPKTKQKTKKQKKSLTIVSYPHLASAIRPASTLLALVLSEVANAYPGTKAIFIYSHLF
jgi:hypothetical protein